MWRWLTPLVAVIAACSSAVPSTTVPERLVVVAADGRLTTMDADGSDTATIVDGSDRLVAQPTWSPGGEWLAWVEVVLSGGPDSVAVVTAAADGSNRTRTAVASPPFYVSWSPDGDRLVVLRNGPTVLVAGVIERGAEEETLVADGQPFYFAWSPGGTELLANIGVADRLDKIDVGLGGGEVAPVPVDSSTFRVPLPDRIRSLGLEPGLFQAPAWVGDRVFWARADEEGQSLVESAPDGSDQRVLATTAGFIHFVVSPDGSKVAFRELDLSAPAVPASLGAQDAAGLLVVVDVATWDAVTVDDDNPFVFLWSPDSSKLLFLSAANEGFIWKVWDGAEVAGYETFVPSRVYGRDYLPFFDQFAQSVEVWAPDSNAFVYAGRAPSDDVSQIWVQPLDGPARAVAIGVFAAFVPAP